MIRRKNSHNSRKDSNALETTKKTLGGAVEKVKDAFKE